MRMVNTSKAMNLLADSAKFTENYFLMESWFTTEKSTTLFLPMERSCLSKQERVSAPVGKELAQYRSLMGYSAQPFYCSFT